MSGITGVIDTALSGLTLFEAGINTVSENLANQSTPGYSVETASAPAEVGPVGQPGIGVGAPVITRAANLFAAGLLNSATSASQAAATQSSSLTAISNALQNNGDVQSAINQLFNDIGTLAANPASGGQRQTVLSDLQDVTSAFQSAATGISDTQNVAGTALSQNVTQVNEVLTQLAGINKNLGTAPNDPNLIDQQQAALQTLSGLLSVNVLPQANGQVILTTGGTVLLDQAGAQTLSLSSNTTTGTPVVIAGATAAPINISGQDGTIGGNIASYQAGAQALQALNARAAIFATQLNNAQAQGLTPSGAQGAALLTVAAPTATAASTNTATASLAATISDSSQLPTDGGPFLLSYNSLAGWSAIDQSSGQSYTLGPGTTLAFAGLTIAVTGSPASGDKFIVNPAPEAAQNIASTTTTGNDIAAADPYVATAGILQSDGSILDSNGGTITPGTDTVTSSPNSSASVVPASYFGQSLQVTFTSPTAYNITTAADPTTTIASGSLTNGTSSIAIEYPPTSPASGEYWQLPITGAPTTGDSLSLIPGGPSSGSNASRIAGLYTATGSTTDGSLQQSFIGLTGTLGANAQQAQQNSSAAKQQVTTATDNLQSISGVSSDQQAVLLTTYQQAYQAAAQVIAAARTAFDSLLQAT